MTAPRTLTSVEIWRRYDAIETRLAAEVTERMLDLAGVRSGTRLMDLAAGRGEPAIPAAMRAGASGVVWAVDLSDELLQLARERAAEAGLSNLVFRAADAQSDQGFPRGTSTP